ncbi:hypothetical protein M2444_004584 [Paenibacillus sp. PastF-3]|nr:hypothetical protein [Paenibacillus sp. PastF-3]
MKIIIVGSVAAGTYVAAKARWNDESDEIIVYERVQIFLTPSAGYLII